MGDVGGRLDGDSAGPGCVGEVLGKQSGGSLLKDAKNWAELTKGSHGRELRANVTI